jgi:hypothetical protein
MYTFIIIIAPKKKRGRRLGVEAFFILPEDKCKGRRWIEGMDFGALGFGIFVQLLWSLSRFFIGSYSLQINWQKNEIIQGTLCIGPYLLSGGVLLE